MWHPRYWLIWIAFGFAWLTTLLPLKWQHGISKSAGRFIFSRARRRRNVVRKNLELTFPEFSVSERESLTNQTIDSFAMSVIETLFVWLRGIKPLIPRVKFNGLEHLENTQGQGIVLLGAHFASLDLCAGALSVKYPYGGTYRPFKNPVVEHFASRSRSRYYSPMLLATNMRGVLAELKQGKTIWFAADQDMGTRKAACFAPFFGIEASTVMTPYRIARLTNSRVVLLSHARNDTDLIWEVNLTPVQLSESPEPKCYHEDAATVNSLIEEEVRKNPSQYFWVHRRFKTMRNGERRDYSVS